MDTMALLCNLYGNGPATLRRLREAGCTSVEGLERAGIDQLALWLADSPDAAQRFLREAQRLNARVAPVAVPVVMGAAVPSTPGVLTAVAEGDDDEEFEGGDDDEYEDEDDDEEFEDEDEDDEDDDEDEDEDDSFGDEEYQEEEAYAEERASRRVPAHAERSELVTRALEAWRTRDQELAPVQGKLPLEEALPTEPAPLQADMLDGLDAACVGSLVARGIGSLESLATADVDALAPAMGLRLTRLLRLRYLARTALTAGAGTPRARTQVASSLTRQGAGPALRAALRAPSVIQPAPGPGAAAAVARTTPPTVRFSPSERPPHEIGGDNPGRLEAELVAAGAVHHGPRTLSRRGEPGASGGPFA